MNTLVGRFLTTVREYFEFSRHKTDLYTEIVAGASTYLALSYIFVVNPTILSTAGISPDAVLFATVVASCLGTLFMGLWAKLPFAVAPGLEMNGFFAFVVCKEMGLTWQQALSVVLISGVVNIIFTRLQIRQGVIDTMPAGLKRALATTVGAFVATIGLQVAHVVSYKHAFLDLHALSLHNILTPEAALMALGFTISLVLYQRIFSFPFGIFLAVFVCAILSHLLNLQTITQSGTRDMFSAVLQYDPSIFKSLLSIHIWAPIIVFFVIDFVGGAGKLIGLTAMTDIQDDEGNVPHLERALYVDGAATILGSALGTSSLVAFVESAIGIRAGGRTGLVAVVCAILIAASLWFVPLLKLIPPQATTGIMLFVGFLLLPWKVDPTNAMKHTYFDLFVGVVMAVVAFLTFGIAKAMMVGFWFYFAKNIFDKGSKRTSAWIGTIAFILSITTALEYGLL